MGAGRGRAAERGARFAARVHRGIQRLVLPSGFRQAHGAELAAVFDAVLRDAQRAEGWPGALRAARRELGSLLRLAVSARRSWRPGRDRPRRAEGQAKAVDRFLQDIRYSIRVLAQRPLFTLVCTVSLGLGIGATSSVSTLVKAVMIDALPVAAPSRLVVPLLRREEGRFQHNFSHADFLDYRRRSETLSGLIAYSPVTVSFRVDGESARSVGQYASDNYFDVLGVTAVEGHTFRSGGDAAPDAEPAVVISYRYWQSRFGGDPGIVGRVVSLNGQPLTLIGVAPEGFNGTYPGTGPEFWVPLTMFERLATGFDAALDLLGSRAGSWLYLMGRLAPGVSGRQARAELDGIAAALAAAYPETNRNRVGIVLMPGERGHHGVLTELEQPLLLLLGVVALLLTIACANVANLLLARATARRREVGVRMALGAGRWRLVQQLLTESALLGLAGGAVGVLLAHWGAALLLAYLRSLSGSPLVIDTNPDPMVLGFAAMLSLLTGIAFGLAPAFRSTRPDLLAALRGGRTTGGATTAGGRGPSLQDGLVVAQVALSFALLVGAGLLVRSVTMLRGIDPGFEPEAGLVMSMDLALAGYPDDRGPAVLARIRDAVAGLPGVEAASFARAVPVDPAGSRGSIWMPSLEDYTPEIDQNIVDVGVFEALGIPLLRGRGFEPGDGPGAPLVAIVNRTFAERYSPGADPIGESIGLAGPDGPRWQIVGVVADGKYRDLREEPRAYVYVPLRQLYRSDTNLIVRTRGDPRGAAEAVRGAIMAVDPEIPVHDVRTLAEQVAESYFETRMTAWLLGLTSAVGLLLAAAGLYGVLGYLVAERTREMGIRVALGAERGLVRRRVLRQGMTRVAFGVVVGLGLAMATSRLLRSLLYGIGPHDPGTLAATVGFLGLVALLACWIPARRATRVDPVIALRQE